MLIPKKFTTKNSVAIAMATILGLDEGNSAWKYSARAARALSKKYQVSMPIVEQVNEVLFDGKPAKDALYDLMLRDRRAENALLEWKE